MKEKRNYCQLKEQEKSLERTHNETHITNPVDPEFKKEIKKVLTELRKFINRNTDHSSKVVETIQRNQSKLNNLTVEIKINLEAMKKD